MRRWTVCGLLLVVITATVACSPQIASVAELPPLEVAPGYAVDPALLPDQVDVVYSNGESGTAEIAWDSASLSKIVNESLELVGQVKGTDLSVTIKLIADVWGEPPRPRLTADELASPNLHEIMEQAITGDPSIPVARSFGHAWSPNGQTLAFATLRHLYFWPLGVAEPEIVAAAEDTGIGGLNDPSWSYDGRYLAVEVQFSWEGHLIVIELPQLSRVRDLRIFGEAYWAFDANQLLIACDSGLTHSTMPNYACTTDLVLLDVESGEQQVLLKADNATLYSAAGWAGSGKILYNCDRVGSSEKGVQLK